MWSGSTLPRAKVPTRTLIMSRVFESHRQFVELAKVVNAIVQNEGLSWKEKYEAIFHPHVSTTMFALAPEWDYYDPDMGYDDDVLAFHRAAQEKAAEYERLIAVVDATT